MCAIYMQIVGFEQISTIDFPGVPAMVLYVGKCSLRCPYCYNYILVTDESEKSIPLSEIIDQIRKAKRFIEGVVITGGEPTIYMDLGYNISAIRLEGMKVKLDTNGTRPKMIKSLLPYLDYIAMDVKSDMVRYVKLGLPIENFNDIIESIEIIKKSGVPYEFRITAVEPFLNRENYAKIGNMIKGAKKFVIQRARMANVLDPNFEQSAIEDLEWYRERFKCFVDNVVIRE
jgi:pyruvate formate lyase activating enzyme